LPQENPQADIPGISERHHQAPLIKKVLLALSATGLTLALFCYRGASYVKAVWKRTESDNSAKISSLPAAANNSTAGTVPPTNVLASASSTALDEPAQKIWSEFEKTALGETLQNWSGQHQGISCKPFRGTMWGLDADRQWSHRCATGEQPEAAHWSFYVFGLQEPLIPRLEQFDASSPTLPEETLKALQSSLQGRLTVRFGPGEDRTPKFVSQRAQRDFSWPNLHWRKDDIEVQLFTSEFDPQRREGRLRLLAQHLILLDALKQDERLKLVGAGTWWYDVGSEMDKQLADQLRTEFPDAALMLVKQQPDPDPEKVREAFQKFQAQLKSQAAGQTGARAAVIAMPPTSWKSGEFYDAIVELLKSAKTAPRARQPVLLLAADQMASRLPWVVESDKSHEGDWREWREQLATLGVTYQRGPYGEPWAYGGDLLKRVWTDYGDTEWGERAFLALLRQGWDTSGDCAAGSDSFRPVIKQGMEFLEKHPNSTYRLDVELAVAQAYETWWSLSQAPTGEELREEEEDVQPANYRDGAEGAHQKSIAAYDHLLQSAPNSDEALYAQRVLPRLKLGIDTGQRRYYCTVGD